MTPFRRHAATTGFAGLLASIVLGAAGASAQTAPATPNPPSAEAQVGGPAAPGAKARPDRAARIERMQAHRAQRLAALKQKLQLTPSQESAWASFESAQRPAARAGHPQRPSREELAALTTPQRLERMQARLAERNASFARRADATRSFYASLTPEQQKTFDAETLHGGHRGHGPGHRPAGDATRG